METVESLARQAYREAGDRMRNPMLNGVVTAGLTILYGPPVERPDLLLISFQGGGAAPVVYDHWPDRMLYLDDEFKPGNAFKFGRNLCSFARSCGLYKTLESSALVMPTIFPCAPADQASAWLSDARGAHKDWREFSLRWLERIVDLAQPSAIVVFGRKASQVLGIDPLWENAEYRHGQGFMTFGTAQYRGCPAVFCGHLSRGYVAAEARRSMRHASELISSKRRNP